MSIGKQRSFIGRFKLAFMAVILLMAIPQSMQAAPVSNLIGKLIKNGIKKIPKKTPPIKTPPIYPSPIKVPPSDYKIPPYVFNRTVREINKSRKNGSETQFRTVPCEHCHGVGRWKCHRCDGTGTIGFIFKDKCNVCDGTGKNKCFWCSGRGKKIVFDK